MILLNRKQRKENRHAWFTLGMPFLVRATKAPLSQRQGKSQVFFVSDKALCGIHFSYNIRSYKNSNEFNSKVNYEHKKNY